MSIPLYKALLRKSSFIFYLVFLYYSPTYAYESQYQKLLIKHTDITVINGITSVGVDYDSWGADPLHSIAVQNLLSTNPTTLKNDALKSYWINAYNLLTISLIIDKNERKSIKNLGSFFTSPWKKYSWKITNKSYTLDDIEHTILRPMGDPRIHMAIVCASASCPDLSNKIYKESTLNTHLDSVTYAFINNPKKGTYTKNNTLYVSKIFDWFQKDFSTQNKLGIDGVIHFISQYKNDNKKTKFNKIKYITYDWSLNKK